MYPSKDENFIRRIEIEIDKYFSNIFKYDKTSLIRNSLGWVQSLIYVTKIKESENPLSSIIYLNSYLNTTNTLIQGAVQYSKDSQNKDFDIEQIFHECENYTKVCDAYIGYSRGLYDASFDEANIMVSFTFKNNINLYKGIFVADLIELMFRKAKATTNEMKRNKKKLLNQLKEKNISMPLINTIKDINDENEISNKLDELFGDVLHETVDRHFETQTQVPTDWDLIGVSMDEFKIGWCSIARISLKETCLFFLSYTLNPEKDREVLIKFRKQKLLSTIQDNQLSIKKAEIILELLTFKESLKNNSIRYQPLIQISSEKYIFAPSFFLEFIPQDNFIAIVNKIDNNLYNQLSNQKEEIMVNELDALYNNVEQVFTKSNTPLPNRLPDIDYLIYDQKSNIAFVIELKFLLKAHELKERLSRDIEIQRGIEQVIEYRDYVNDNIEEIIRQQFNIQASSIRTCFFILSRNGVYSGNYSTEIPVISYFRFMGYMMNTRFDALYNIISNKRYVPQPNIDFEEDISTFEFGGYKFSIPSLNPVIIKELNDYLLYDKKLPIELIRPRRNAPCPCGSGKKYKKCCGK